jgi:protein SCO1/2
MKKPKILMKYTVLVGVLFFVPFALVFFFAKGSEQHFYTLPYYDPSFDPPYYKVTPLIGEELDASDFHRLPDFNLTSHKGLSFTQDSLADRVWLTSFFATNSDYVLSATKQLLNVNFKFKGEENIGILCITLDPEHDTPEVLAKYIEQVEAKKQLDDKWYFLTGDRAEVFKLIDEGFLIQDTTSVATMCLIDTDLHMRGRYNANYTDSIKSAKEDIALLNKEMDRAAKARNED